MLRKGAFLNVTAKSIYEMSQGAKAQRTRQVICKITFVNFSLKVENGTSLLSLKHLSIMHLSAAILGEGGAGYAGDIRGYGAGFVNF